MSTYSLPLKRFQILSIPSRVLRLSPFSIPRQPPTFLSFRLQHSGIGTPLLGRRSRTKFYQVRSMAGKNSPGLAVKNIPDGWFDDDDRLEDVAECFPNEIYGLPPAKVILVDQEDSNFLVECGGKYFFWNDLSDDIARIDEPNELSHILQAMKENPEKLKTTLFEMPGADKSL